jgi:hypothetical protein
MVEEGMFEKKTRAELVLESISRLEALEESLTGEPLYTEDVDSIKKAISYLYRLSLFADRTKTCPLARYLHSHGFPDAIVTDLTWRINSVSYVLPVFVSKMDKT